MAAYYLNLSVRQLLSFTFLAGVGGADGFFFVKLRQFGTRVSVKFIFLDSVPFGSGLLWLGWAPTELISVRISLSTSVSFERRCSS
jgi:hypothetical protein